MTQFSAGASLPYEMPSRWYGRCTDYPESLAPPCAAVGGRRLPVSSASSAILEATCSQASGAGATALSTDLQEYGESVVAERSAGFSAASPLPLRLPSASRRYYLQPLAAATGGQASAVDGGAAAASSASGMSPQVHYSQAPRSGDEAPASSTGSTLYSISVSEAESGSLAARDGAHRRLQTERPLHRAHPYGSSLLGRLVNKITRSLTSLSSFVPRASAVSRTEQKNDDTACAADAARGASPGSHEGARPNEVLYSPLQEPVYGSSVSSSGAGGGANTCSLRKLPASGAAHVGPTTRSAAAPAAFVPTNATSATIRAKDTQEGREDTAAGIDGDFLWLSDKQHSLPYHQPHPGATTFHGAAAGPADLERAFCEQGSYVSIAYQQKLQPQEQQELRLQQLQQAQQQQQLRHQQVQAGESGRGRGGRGFDNDTGERRRPVRLGGPCMSLSADAVQEEAVAAEGGAGEKRAAAGVSAMQPCSHYEVPRPRKLAESCFDAEIPGSVAPNANADACGALFLEPRSVPQQQQRLHTVLSEDRDFGPAWTAENQQAEGTLCYDDYGVAIAAAARGRFDSSGRLLLRNGNSVFLAQEQGRLEQQQMQQELCVGLVPPVNVGASLLPLRRDFLQECSVGQRQQYGVPIGGRKQVSGFQEEIGSGVSLSGTSSNSVLFTVPDDVIPQTRRRSQRGCGGASSSLFSHAVAPAWLSSATADLLDADAGAAAATGEAAAVADATREQSSRAARAAPRSTRRTGVATKKAAAGGRSSPLLNPRQEQLTVEQLQKLYLRCQPLRWRVRLRDLLRQEVVVAAAAEKKCGQVLEQSEPMVATSGTLGVASPADGSHDGAAAQRGAVSEKEIQRPSVDSSSQTQQAKEEGSRPEDATARGGSGAEEAALSMHPGRTAVTTQRATIPKEQDQQPVVAAQTGSGGECLLDKPSVPGGMMQHASSRGEERKEEQKQPQQVSKTSFGVTGEDSDVAAGFGVHEQERERDTTGGAAGTKDMSAVSLSGAPPHDIDAADDGKRSKLTGEAAAADGGVTVSKSLFGSGATGAGGAGAPGSTMFGSSNSTSLFGVRRTAPVASAFEKEKPHVGGVAEEQSNGTRTSATEKSDIFLLGKSSVDAKAGGSSTVPAPLFGGSSSSSLVEGVTAAATHQQQEQESKESPSDKTGATTPSLLSGIAPASRLFGGARSSSTPQKQGAPPVLAEQASAASQPPAHKQAAKEQPPIREAASTSSTDGHGIKDTASSGKATATTTAGGTGGVAADKPAQDTPALPWWQQNLNKPCTVMPEEDFAPDADDEEEAGEEKDKDSEKELPPLKVPNIFGNSSSSGGGLFGLSGADTSSLSLFKTTAESSFPSAKPSAAPTASSAGAAAGPSSLFGSSSTGAGLWNQNSSSSSLFGGLKLSAPGSSTPAPSGSLFGGHDASKPSSALSSAKSDAVPGASNGGSGTSGEKGPTSLFGNLTASSSAFATQKTSASLFGGSIFGNPVAASQSVNSSQQTPGASAAPTTGLFVFGAGAGGSTSSSAATTAPPAGQSQLASGGTTAVSSVFGSALQQSQQNGSGTGKRGRDAADGGGAVVAPAAKSLFGATPASTAAAAGGGLGLFGQRQLAGGSTLFGGGNPGSGGLFNTSGTVTSPPPGQTEKNAAGKTGFEGGGIFGYRDGSSSSTPGPIFGATRSVTPVFGSNSSSKEPVGSSSSAAAAGAGGAAPGASAATGSSLGLFGSSSSNNNPFGFGGSTGTSGVSLFGGSTSTPADSTRSATAEGSFTAVQPLWSAGKGTATTQGLFSGASNSNAGISAAASRVDAGAAGGAASNGMHQPSRSLFGDSVGGNSRSATGQVDARSTAGVQGGSSSVPSSLFGNAPGTSAFTFGAAPASAAAQQQQQPSGSASTSAGGAPAAGGVEAGNGANAFFGALPPGVRRPRLTIKRSKR